MNAKKNTNRPELIARLNALPGVHCNEWKHRHYINLAGNGANYRGERNTKLYVEDNRLTIDYGKGTCSSAWCDQRDAVEAVFA